jgi:hypothetical protein
MHFLFTLNMDVLGVGLEVEIKVVVPQRHLTKNIGDERRVFLACQHSRLIGLNY